MIGIYKITNIKNNKIYIGKSTDIKRRWKEHIRHSKDEHKRKKCPLHMAINKYGKDLFKFEVIEECKVDVLDEREMYYIKLFDSKNKKKGYNITNGGDGGPIMYGSLNPNSVLSEDDVVYIRECYKNGVYKMDCYKVLLEKNGINYNTFSSIWHGRSYVKIMPEVFTEENRIIHRNIAFEKRTPKHCNKVKKYVLEIREKQKK